MVELMKLPNIGKELAQKLEVVGITSYSQLKEIGSEEAIIKLATVFREDVCINMLYALEGAILNVRWHYLEQERKTELLHFFRLITK